MFSTSYQVDSPLLPYAVGAIIVGFVVGSLTIWRPSVGVLWFCILELLSLVGIAAVFVTPPLRAQKDIGYSLFYAIVPSGWFLLCSVGTAFVIALPGCAIRAIIRHRRS
jgi:hypothetical protein